MFKVITWNVNSIKVRLGQVLKLLEKEQPDALLLQEIKCEKEGFPFDEILDAGYNSAVLGQKSYNGVAILSKVPIEDVEHGFKHHKKTEARFIEGVVYRGETPIRLASIYVPNGNPNGDEAKTEIQLTESERFKYKMEFFDGLYERFKEGIDTGEIAIFGGDINVAPEDIDVYSVKNWTGHICFLPEEKAKFRALLNIGWADAVRVLAGKAQVFSWYNYRTNAYETGKGIRIDHLMTSPLATDKLHGYKILNEYRGMEKPSDHVPIEITLDI